MVPFVVSKLPSKGSKRSTEMVLYFSIMSFFLKSSYESSREPCSSFVKSLKDDIFAQIEFLSSTKTFVLYKYLAKVNQVRKYQMGEYDTHPILKALLAVHEGCVKITKKLTIDGFPIFTSK